MAVINVDDIYILDNTGQQVDDAVDYGLFNSNDNLLDNAYFVGGGSQLGDGIFPINQRGQTSYSVGQCIDRWYGDGEVTLTANGINSPTSALMQIASHEVFDRLWGKTLTASVMYADGTIVSGTATWPSANPESVSILNYGDSGLATAFYPSSNPAGGQLIRIVGSNIAAAKLELGTVSTIANDVPPDFGEELRKCQRRLRYVPLKRTPVILDGGYSVAVITLTGIEMASFPTASLITAGTAYAYNPLTSATPTSASVIAFDYNTPTIQLVLNAALNGMGVVYDTVIQLSCEL